uniref:Uncharacterized protein n=1 Tax=Anguilla anguilla TaxID=7936 RepID=A0A0E9VG55_ANGAN
MGELLGHRKGDHHHVDGGVALCECTEERWDWPVELFHCAFGGGRCVAVVLRIAHSGYHWTSCCRASPCI